MKKQELANEFAEYYRKVCYKSKSKVEYENILNWLRDYKNIDTNIDDELVRYIYEMTNYIIPKD